MTSTLKIVTNRHASKRGYCVGQVDSDDSCRRLANPKEEWIVTWPTFVGMVRIVPRPEAAKLEKYTAAYRVIRRPVIIGRKSAKLWRLRSQVSRGDVLASAKITSM